MRFSLYDGFWIKIRDGDLEALQLFEKHYSKYHYADKRKVKRFVGPGERIVLINSESSALFVWRKMRWQFELEGINCSVFINKSDRLSSELILEAEKFAREKWPEELLITFVNPKKINSTNPGYCFKKAGWKYWGLTKKRRLVVLIKE